MFTQKSVYTKNQLVSWPDSKNNNYEADVIYSNTIVTKKN